MPKQPRMFFLIVRDKDTRTFSVEGPMSDDTVWIERVNACQKQGRQVNCSSSNGVSVDEIAHSYAAKYGYVFSEQSVL